MAETLSACPRDESVLAGLEPQNAAGGPWPAVGLLAEAGSLKLLRAAVLLHAGALAVALLMPHMVHSAASVVTGLVVLLLVLAQPQIAGQHASSAVSTTAAPPAADLSPAAEAAASEPENAPAPAPLPFMGERIVLNAAAGGLPGLARAAARLRRASSARSHPWGELIARVSHELRTPLNAVIGFSDVMQAELLGPVGHPRYREYARHIRDCGRDLLKSAEDTLALTCLLDHDPAMAIEPTVDLAALVQECWAFHAGDAEGLGLALDADIPAGLEVLVDRRPMRQILINLLAEAMRRADARGTVGLVASIDGDLVQIEVFLRGRPDRTAVGQASLPICLARALLELQGAALIEVDDPFSTWRALTVLRCAAQEDFFNLPAAPAGEPIQLC
jgi:signal transduction histidine kinase